MDQTKTRITILNSIDEFKRGTIGKIYDGEIPSEEYSFVRNHWDDDIAFLKTIGANNPEVDDYDEGYASYKDDDGKIYILTV